MDQISIRHLLEAVVVVKFVQLALWEMPKTSQDFAIVVLDDFLYLKILLLIIIIIIHHELYFQMTSGTKAVIALGNAVLQRKGVFIPTVQTRCSKLQAVIHSVL